MHLQSLLTKLGPHHFFICTAAIFGLIMVFLTPPFQVPDEVNHFYRAYQIADGRLSGETYNQRLGGHVPESLIKFAEPFLDLRWKMNRKTSFEKIRQQLSIRLDQDKKAFIDFPNTALYSPVSYMPQACAIFVLKNLNLRPLLIFYGARIFTLFIWIVCIGFAIKILPRFKWLFTFLALLPMSMFVNMSLSADVVTNIIAFLFLAFVLKMSTEDVAFTSRDFMILSGFAVLLASAKIVYTPLIFLFVLIPLKRFKSARIFYGYLIALLFIGFGTAWLWSKSINSIYIPYAAYNVEFRNNLDLMACANMYEQISYLLDHGVHLFNVFTNSMVQTFDMFYQGYIGTFGWLDAKMPEWLIHLSYLMIFLVAIFENPDKKYFSWRQKLLLFLTITSIISALLLSQLLTWECVGSDVIKTIQGRYFIPVFPLLFMLFHGAFRVNYSGQNMIKGVVSIYSILLLSLSCLVIYKRYYVYPDYAVLEIKTDAEQIEGNKFVTSDPDIFLDNASQQTDEASRSGHYSVKLSGANPYGFTYRYHEGHYGDIIQVEVWRLGNSGSIAISGDSGKKFYAGTNEASLTDANGWSKLSFSYTIESEMHGKEIGIYLFNKNEASYFDDLTITILKRPGFLGI
jgi:uncharacterized membrane protein